MFSGKHTQFTLTGTWQEEERICDITDGGACTEQYRQGVLYTTSREAIKAIFLSKWYWIHSEDDKCIRSTRAYVPRPHGQGSQPMLPSTGISPDQYRSYFISSTMSELTHAYLPRRFYYLYVPGNKGTDIWRLGWRSSHLLVHEEPQIPNKILRCQREI